MAMAAPSAFLATVVVVLGIHLASTPCAGQPKAVIRAEMNGFAAANPATGNPVLTKTGQPGLDFIATYLAPEGADFLSSAQQFFTTTYGIPLGPAATAPAAAAPASNLTAGGGPSITAVAVGGLRFAGGHLLVPIVLDTAPNFHATDVTVGGASYPITLPMSGGGARLIVGPSGAAAGGTANTPLQAGSILQYGSDVIQGLCGASSPLPVDVVAQLCPPAPGTSNLLLSYQIAFPAGSQSNPLIYPYDFPVSSPVLGPNGRLLGTLVLTPNQGTAATPFKAAGNFTYTFS
ncbi:hypothetical protein WJX72_003288 [[Myrmecia] bisecta]|uniref:Uncharacterized protein n=1 Tax=[Myrmecia] bisecta TaxID=41462 RepID=A0AAW1R5B7_9CHLO